MWRREIHHGGTEPRSNLRQGYGGHGRGRVNSYPLACCVEHIVIEQADPNSRDSVGEGRRNIEAERSLLVSWYAERSDGGSSPHKPSAQMGDGQSMCPTPDNHSDDCPSPICEDLSSESPCLCGLPAFLRSLWLGESSCAAGKYRMQVGYGMPKTLANARVRGPVSGLMGW